LRDRMRVHPPASFRRFSGLSSRDCQAFGDDSYVKRGYEIADRFRSKGVRSSCAASASASSDQRKKAHSVGLF
jgi:hypothetical protein